MYYLSMSCRYLLYYYQDIEMQQEMGDRIRMVEDKSRNVHAVAGFVKEGILDGSQNVDGILKHMEGAYTNLQDSNQQLVIKTQSAGTKRMKLILCLILFAVLIITLYL